MSIHSAQLRLYSTKEKSFKFVKYLFFKCTCISSLKRLQLSTDLFRIWSVHFVSRNNLAMVFCQKSQLYLIPLFGKNSLKSLVSSSGLNRPTHSQHCAGKRPGWGANILSPKLAQQWSRSVTLDRVSYISYLPFKLGFLKLPLQI